MVFKRYEDIIAWQKGRDLVMSVYQAARVGDFAKDWGLRDQIQRAAVSVCSNIAEGYARRGNKEFVKFLWIAKGSSAEVQSQLYYAKDLSYISEETFNTLYTSTNEIQACLCRLIQSIGSDPERQKL